MNNKKIITGFISQVWNQGRLAEIDHFIHEEFTDHSLPPFLPPNKQGLTQWISETGKSFEHKTIIEDIVCESNKVMLRINMQMKHVGEWRGIKPTGKEVIAAGYRCFKVSDFKIVEHWALIDGNSIENQLKDESHGCNVKR
ncbi:putative ester cyclase [Flammeovirgaceae bacterium 311]|nr:putative ester cyclase [Flammeovirgaceae bacterium 311]